MVNVELGEFSVRANQMQILGPEFGQFADYEHLFGRMDPTLRPQCARIKSAEHCEHVRLLAQRCDLQMWTADPRDMSLRWSRAFPEGVQSEESWAIEILSPIRDAVVPGATLYLPDQPSAHAGLVFLSAIVPPARASEPTAPSNTRGTRSKVVAAVACVSLKQIVVMRQPPLVLVFNVVSCGRSWYRTCIFTSDASQSLHEPLASDVSAHLALPPPSGQRGDPSTAVDPQASLRISRDVPGSEGQQMYLPTRFLLALLPDALLSQYDFWQQIEDGADGDAQHLRGYEKSGAAAAVTAHHELHVRITRASLGDDAEAQVWRVPVGSHDSRGRAVLLNPSTLGSTAIGNLLTLCLRIDSASQVLIWCSAIDDAHPGAQHVLSRVELPRGATAQAPGRCGLGHNAVAGVRPLPSCCTLAAFAASGLLRWPLRPRPADPACLTAYCMSHAALLVVAQRDSTSRTVRTPTAACDCSRKRSLGAFTAHAASHVTPPAMSHRQSCHIASHVTPPVMSHRQRRWLILVCPLSGCPIPSAHAHAQSRPPHPSLTCIAPVVWCAPQLLPLRPPRSADRSGPFQLSPKRPT